MPRAQIRLRSVGGKLSNSVPRRHAVSEIVGYLFAFVSVCFPTLDNSDAPREAALSFEPKPVDV